MRVKKQKEEKQKIQKKNRRLKKQTIVRNIESSNASIPDEKISQHNQYFYVYGIINNKDDIKPDFKGLKDKTIQKFEIKDIIVLFSFYPTLHPVVEEKEALLHAEILNKITSKITIVPMAFGTVFKDKYILKTVLTKSYPAVKKALELIKNKIELGIKVVKKEETSEEVNLRILKELNKLSVKSTVGDKFSERLLINNSFLVEKNNFAKFSGKVGELEQKYPNLKFLYTGPWPAYSFININIKGG